jgi:hypothetical protein
MKTTDIEAIIDTLDHAERTDFRTWRKPLSDLEESLHKAQRLRRWIGAPLLGAAVAIPGWLSLSESEWATWFFASVVIGTVALWLMQLVLERFYPVLDREARIQALAGFFRPWRDYDELEEERST